MSTLLGGIFSLGLTIASAVLLIYVINHSAADELGRLKSDTTNAQAILAGLQSRLPDIQECEVELLNSTARVTNCSQIVTAGLNLNVELLTNKTATLSENTVENANATVTEFITLACTRIATLQNRIIEAESNATVAVPRILQNGSVIVELVGGDKFNLSYSLEELLAGDLRMVYLVLPAWANSLTTVNGTTDPTIRFHSFYPSVSFSSLSSSDINLPLLKTQAERFQWVNVGIQAATYEWDSVNEEIQINSIGTSVAFDTVAQLQPLKLAFQYI